MLRRSTKRNLRKNRGPKSSNCIEPRNCIEPLESRVLLSTITWINSSGGSWNTASNWSGGVTPGSGDDVVINQPGNISITISASTAAHSLQLTGDTLVVSAGTLSLGADSAVNSGATLSETGGNVSVTGSLINTGTISIAPPSQLTISGTFTQNGTLSMAPGALISGVGQNLLGNPDFESPAVGNSTTTNPNNWGNWGTSVANKQFAFTGAQSLVESNGNSGVNQSFSVTPGISYILSAYAMTPSTNKLTGPQGAFLNLFFFDASGNQLSASTGITALNANSAAGGPLTGSVGGQGWNFFSVSAVAPSNAVRATVALQAGPYTGISGTGGGLVYWDNAQFGPQAHTSAVVSAAGVTNNGSITIGAGDTINSSGTFAQTSTGILNTQLGGPAASLLYGSVTATGAATLGGILNATLTNGYSPSVNDGFHILTYQGETGTFAGYGLPTGGSYKFVGAVGPMDTGIGAIPLAPSATVSVGTVLGSAPPAVVGVNLAWWDSKLTTTQTQQMVTAAGLNMFRFPGGSSSDDYHFNVSANFGDGIANTIPQFAQFIQAVGGTGLVTTDYGSGSPQEAEAELAYLLGSPTDTTSIGTGIEWNDSANQWQNVNWQTVGYWASLRAATPLATDDGLNFLRINHAAIFLNVTYWEIGNEEYGSWEVDHHGTSGPGGVSTGAQHDPATYAKFALAFANFVAADQANFPILRIGIDSGDPTGAGDNNWTRNVITQGAAIGFVPGFISDHSYMQGPGSESDSFLLNNTVSNPASTLDWSVRYADYKAMLTTIDGSAAAANTLVMATEYNSNYGVEGKQMVSIVNGLFVADSIGSLLDSGYQAGLFWDLRNGWTTSGNNSPTLYGWRQGGDEGILGDPNNTSIAPSTGPYVPYPNYFAEQLASKIAQSGGKVLSVTSSYNEMAVYSVLEPNGHLDLMVINKNPDADIAEQFNISGFNASGQGAQVWRYGEAEDFAQSQTTTGAASLTNFTTNLTISGGNFSYLFPAYSMTVIDLAPALTVATAAAATPNPVTGTSTALSALGAENGTDAGLTYTWSTISAPGGVAAPVFSSNGTNSSKNTAATLFGVGNYTFLVTITDSSSNGVTSSVNVTVNQTLSSIVVSPGTVTMNQSGSQQFSATALDQFAKPMSSQPAFTWSLQGGSAGGITAGGLYSATAGVSGTAIVIATSGAVQGTAAIVDSAAVSSYTWQNAAIGAGGFVDGIFYSPNQPNVIYARTDIGGLYKTTNDGASWQQLLDFVGSSTGTSGNGTQMQEIGVLSFAIDPENPNNLYAMAGEYSGTNGAVFYSTNGGQTWGQTNLSFYVGGNSNGRATGERIALEPYDRNLYINGNNANGPWESTNSGHSFTQVTTFPSAGNSGINFVYFNPYGGTANSPTQNIFVGVNSTVAGTNLYRTTNGGTSWTEITGTGSAPNAWMPNRAALASDGNLYVAYSNGLAPNSSLTNGGVFRFNITSGVWTNIPTDVPQVTTGPRDQFG